jgi:hypothetical protein
MKSIVVTLSALLILSFSHPSMAADWGGLIDRSSQLRTDTFSFTGSNSEAYDSNENYYDGDFADFDGDGLMDRGLGARYGLLKNTGDGFMTPYSGPNLVNFLFRGWVPGWGEDAFQWADVDNDGDLDVLQGGNGEPFTLQINAAGRFRTKWTKTGSALSIVNIDIDKDGDVDLAVAHSFCSDVTCGHGCPETNCAGTWPKEFRLWLNDGAGNFTDVSAARGFSNFGTNLICGVAAGDVDGDGDFDLMMINGIGRGITRARNNGAGSFTNTLIPFAVAMAPIRPLASGFGQGMNLGDIDGDGDLDLAIALVRDPAGSSHRKVGHAIFINDGTGNFLDETATRFDATQATNNFLIGDNGKLVDLDYDGDLDFVAFDSRTARLLQLYLNDGTGRFTYSSNYSMILLGGTSGSGTGADTDVTDVDGDGTYDCWVGSAGSDVRILINSYRSPDGLPANVPRNFQVVSANSNGVTLSWQHPAYADVTRWYKVYRSTAPGLTRSDWRLIKRVTNSRHQDEGFVAPITRFTTTAYLNDPDVTFIGASNQVQFIDRTAAPGVIYYYAVTHVGTENTESRQTTAVAATIPPLTGLDTTKPFLDIVSPRMQDWSALPRIVLQYGDGGSGIDTATLRVSFNAPLGSGNSGTGGRAANADISDLFFRKDDKAYIAALQPPLSLATNTLVTLTARISDRAGNATTNQVQFFVSISSAQPPSAVLTVSPTNGLAPLVVNSSANGSSDPDGKLLSWEWYFGDGTTGLGRNLTKTFTTGGSFPVMLLVRDAQGGVGSATRTITVSDFLILSASMIATNFTLSFPTATNSTYVVERTASLSPPGWTELIVRTGNGSVQTVTHTNVPDRQQFYRVRVD